MITLRDVSKTVTEPDGSTRTLFDRLHFDLREDDRSVAITGRSGSGKSTLLRVLAGLDTDFEGTYVHDGHILERTASRMAAYRLRHIGIVTQDHSLLGDRSVLDNVRLGVPARADSAGRARDALEAVGISHLAGRRPRRLSGGEAQRVAIARAIAKRPAVVLADEPTGALDETTEDDVLALFDQLQQAGTTFVIVTHSERVAQRCGRRFHLQHEQLIECST
ncbi:MULTISPECIES: ABC transporter ATP-binding protein [unclassified Curtobacterium]|uniref:ABC transporter ATP-binding protein n=1 Tax=unclassified Curtobacterium TaxID=257496 RepID=UPI00104891C4|nr:MULTISPECIES: ATP-binding cassette domain-containing protein [unclassified Curtobacterium]MBF4604552.1 ATP-binding cassette domain-containing protein [Curtobacterium sp. VKM Ac-2884]TCU43203.1 putative ABC transport system ATP-binding protein [Curtobacterium sp. PhB146]